MFGDKVRARRLRLGMTQEELASRTGISVRGIQNLEVGRVARPRPTTVRLLADAFALTGAERDRFCASALAGAAQPDVDGPPGVTPGQPVPALLPADVADFAGRGDQLRQLTSLLDSRGASPTAVVISAIAGTAGVGKTTLAVHWSHRVKDRFPDGQLYVNLRGFDPRGTVMDPAEAVRRFLDTLGVPAQRIPADPDAQVSLYRSLLATKKMLIVLDNARDPDQVGPLLPGASGSLVVITSRNRLSGLVATAGAHPIALDLLTPDEAEDMLALRLGARRVAAEREAVNQIIACCARLPLALVVVAANAATQPGLSLAAVAAGLQDAGNRLAMLSTGDTLSTDVRAVFSWSYHALTPAAARLFRLLGLHPGPEFTAPAAASLAALPIGQARTLLTELARACLATESVPGRYTFHDLLRAYAADLAHTTDPDDERRAATHRILDHYLHTAHTADRLLHPTRDPITVDPPGVGVTPEAPTDIEQALAWFTAEHAVLLATVDHAATIGMDTHTWQLAWALATFLFRRGHWHDQAATGRAAVAAAERLADRAAQAYAHRHLVHGYLRLGRLDDAHTHLRRALDLDRQAGDRIGQAHTEISLAMLREQQGRHTDALHHAQQALALHRAAGHRPGQALALNAVGWLHAQLDDHQRAIASCEQALTAYQELGDRPGQAETWDSLGYAHHHLGQHAHAVACYQHALDLYRDLGNRYWEATTLTHLGDTHRTTGDPDAARHAWQQAMTILDQLDHPDADGVRARLDQLDLPRR